MCGRTSATDGRNRSSSKRRKHGGLAPLARLQPKPLLLFLKNRGCSNRSLLLRRPLRRRRNNARCRTRSAMRARGRLRRLAPMISLDRKHLNGLLRLQYLTISRAPLNRPRRQRPLRRQPRRRPAAKAQSATATAHHFSVRGRAPRLTHARLARVRLDGRRKSIFKACAARRPKEPRRRRLRSRHARRGP